MVPLGFLKDTHQDEGQPPNRTPRWLLVHWPDVLSVCDSFCKTMILKHHILKHLQYTQAVVDIGLMDYYGKGSLKLILN